MGHISYTSYFVHNVEKIVLSRLSSSAAAAAASRILSLYFSKNMDFLIHIELVFLPIHVKIYKASWRFRLDKWKPSHESLFPSFGGVGDWMD